MAGREFESIRERLLPLVERSLVEDHAALHRDLLGERWSPPAAYRWMRYESPDPVAQLATASERLEQEWAAAEAAAGGRAFRERSSALVDAAIVEARRLGYSE